MKNFNRPYFAKTVSEFWKRWHISLSTWFTDYLYITLGGNRVSIPRWYFNLFFVFIVSGLWHGANWTFIIWGGLNGLYLVIAIIKNKYIKTFTFSKPFQKLFNYTSIITTFSMISLSWIFFRANSVQEGARIVMNLFKKGALFFDGNVFYAFFGLSILIITEYFEEYYPSKSFLFKSKNKFIKMLSFATLIIIILTIGVFDGGQFIYFQF
jgi:D-alanyl-lipoteichoic acid acyltransferase DltB (MBOAT superfamily)